MKKLTRRQPVTVNRQSEQAFTLIELLIVVAVLGLLMTLATLAWKEAKVRAYDAQALICARSIKVAEAVYLTDNRRYTTYENLAGQDLSACGTVYSAAEPERNLIFAQLPSSLIPAAVQAANLLQSGFGMASAQAVAAGAPAVGPVGNGNDGSYAYQVLHSRGRTTFLVSETYLGPLSGAPAAAIAQSNTGTGAPSTASVQAPAPMATAFPTYNGANKANFTVYYQQSSEVVYYGVPVSYVVTDPDGVKVDVTPPAPTFSQMMIPAQYGGPTQRSTSKTFYPVKPGTYTMTVSSTGNCVSNATATTSLCPKTLSDFRSTSKSYTVLTSPRTNMMTQENRFTPKVIIQTAVRNLSARNIVLEAVRAFNTTGNWRDASCAGDCVTASPSTWYGAVDCARAPGSGFSPCTSNDVPGVVYMRFRPYDPTRPMNLTGLSGWSATGVIPVGAPNVTGPRILPKMDVQPTVTVNIDTTPGQITSVVTTRTVGDASGYLLPLDPGYTY